MSVKFTFPPSSVKAMRIMPLWMKILMKMTAHPTLHSASRVLVTKTTPCPKSWPVNNLNCRLSRSSHLSLLYNFHQLGMTWRVLWLSYCSSFIMQRTKAPNSSMLFATWFKSCIAGGSTERSMLIICKTFSLTRSSQCSTRSSISFWRRPLRN